MFSWFRGKQFGPPTPPLRDYWATVQVELHEPLAVDGDPPTVGYIQILGLRCEPSRARPLIEDCIRDGTVVWEDGTEWHEVALNDLSRGLRKVIEPRNEECVWYQSGKVFFPTEPSAEEGTG